MEHMITGVTFDGDDMNSGLTISGDDMNSGSTISGGLYELWVNNFGG